jgi:Arc/MetJ family transcription regulator
MHGFLHQLMRFLASRRRAMRTTVTLDDEMMAKASAYTGVTDRSALIREALQALVAREAARRMIALGGSDPTAAAAPRRRPPHFLNPE